MQEMPLLIFTLLEQTAIGALITLLIMQFAGKAKTSKTNAIIGYVIVGLGVIAMLASLLHLGQPGRAFNALRGLGTSWLSREILFFALFVVAAIIYAILNWVKKDGIAKVFGIIAAVLGVLSIIATSLSYMVPGVPAWDNAWTPIQFILTVVVCGIPLTLALQKTLDKEDKAATWWIVFAVLFISQIVMRWLFYSNIELLINLV